MSKGPFSELVGSWIVLASKGVYSQAALYRRGDALFAKRGGGFIRVYGRREGDTTGGTSIPDINWDEFDLGDTTLDANPDGFNRMVLRDVAGRKRSK